MFNFQVPCMVNKGSLASDTTKITSVGLGWRHSVALDDQARVHCWGHSISGRYFNKGRKEQVDHFMCATDGITSADSALELSTFIAEEPAELPIIIQPGQTPQERFVVLVASFVKVFLFVKFQHDCHDSQ